MRKKFWILQNIPSPYRLTMFDEMYRQLDGEGIDFHVHFMARGHRERPRSWWNPKIDFPHTYWNDCGYNNHHFNPGLILEVRREKPDYLLVGNPYDTFTSIIVAWMCPAVVRACWVEGQTKTPRIMNGFIGWFKRLVLSKYRLAAVPGLDGKKYFDLHQSLTSRKMPKCIYLPNLVDETRFKVRSEWSKGEINNARHSLGVDEGDKLCLIIARLDSVKGLLPFIQLLTPEMLKGWKIVIFGEGPQKDDILALIRQRNLESHIALHPYMPYSQVPVHYAAADLFLLPSMHDPNPLSVPEALHSGLPVAISSQCGNVEEGCTDGKNGWVLPVLDRAAYAKVLAKVFCTSIDELRAMGRWSKEKNAIFWNSQSSIAKFFNDMGVN